MVICPKTIVCNYCQMVNYLKDHNNNEISTPMAEGYDFKTSHVVETPTLTYKDWGNNHKIET